MDIRPETAVDSPGIKLAGDAVLVTFYDKRDLDRKIHGVLLFASTDSDK